MPSNSSETTVTPCFYSFCIHFQMKWQLSINFSFSLELLMIFSFLWRQLLVKQLMMRVLMMRMLLMIFRTSFLHNLFSSFAFLQHKLPFCRFQCTSFVLPKHMLDFKDTNFLSMVLHTWTNISISNWHILIPCYHQNLKVVLLNTFCSNNLPLFDDDKH